MTSQIFEFLKLWDLLVHLYILKEHDEKCLPAKNQHLIAIWGEILALLCLGGSIQILLVLLELGQN